MHANDTRSAFYLYFTVVVTVLTHIVRISYAYLTTQVGNAADPGAHGRKCRY